MAELLECVLIPSSILVALKGSQVSPKVTCSYGIYIYSTYTYWVAMLNGKCALYYGYAWNNSYSGLEEATLCIVICIKGRQKVGKSR